MPETSDLEIVKALGSRSYEEAAAAQKEVMRRGEKMIPLLLLNKGNKRDYGGGGLGKETSAWLFVRQGEGNLPKEFNKLVLTVEIASLYLISGIYYGRLDFAEGPVLTDISKPDDKRRVLNNNSKAMKRVYNAYADWVKKVKRDGLDALRKRNEPPLAGTQFAWW